MGDGGEVAFYDDLGLALDDLQPGWAALAASAEQPLFFQSPDWLRHVARIRIDHADRDWRLCIATFWRKGRLAALWPLSLQREGLCWIARSLDDPFGQFAGFLCRDEDDQDRAIDAILDALKAKGVAAGLMIERVPEGSTLQRRLTAAGAKVVHSDQSVLLDFRPFESFQAYLKTRRSKTRKNLRNALNRLKRDHNAHHEVVTADGHLQSVMDQALDRRLIWMQDNAKTAPAFRDRDFRRVLDGHGAGSIQADLIGFRLATGDTPISVQWGFVHAERYYAFISARNPAFDAYSPGRIHLGMVLEACFERGIRVVEMMAPASDYKMNWTDQVRRIDDLGLPFTAGGYLYLDLWRRHGRAAARRIYHRLPGRLRRKIAPATTGNTVSSP